MSRFPFPFPGTRGGYQSSSGRPMFGMGRPAGQSSRGSGFKTRLIIAAVIALFAIISYYAAPRDENKVTGKAERVAFSEEADEMQLGLQAAPEMIQQHGGESRNPAENEHVRRVGSRLLQALDRALAEQDRSIPYEFDFHLLADPQTVNAFALPGGQVFITKALYAALETEGQLAGVLGHEIGHVLERHGNKRMAKQKLFSGLAMAGGVAGGDQQSAQMSQAVAQMISMKYGRDDELESDSWGVKLTAMAGYDPRAMIGVMKVLENAGGGGGQPEFFSTHPKPANRVDYIEDVIQKQFPNGIPSGLTP